LRRATAYSNSCSQVVLVYLHPFRCNSLLKVCCSRKLQKNHQNPLFWWFRVVQGH